MPCTPPVPPHACVYSRCLCFHLSACAAVSLPRASPHSSAAAHPHTRSPLIDRLPTPCTSASTHILLGFTAPNPDPPTAVALCSKLVGESECAHVTAGGIHPMCHIDATATMRYFQCRRRRTCHRTKHAMRPVRPIGWLINVARPHQIGSMTC